MKANGYDPASLSDSSTRALIVVAFAKNRSPSYPICTSLQETAESFWNIAAGRTTMHVAAFGRTARQAEAAIGLLGYLEDIKGVQAYGGGRLLLGLPEAKSVLRCFAEYSSSPDRAAHCHRVIEDPFPIRPDLEISHFSLDGAKRYLFPCAYLLRHGFAIDPGHPSPVAAQIMAGAVRVGCDWCPNFDGRFIELEKEA